MKSCPGVRFPCESIRFEIIIRAIFFVHRSPPPLPFTFYRTIINHAKLRGRNLRCWSHFRFFNNNYTIIKKRWWKQDIINVIDNQIFFSFFVSHFLFFFSTGFCSVKKKKKKTDREEKNIRKRGFAFAILYVRFNKQQQNVWRMRRVAIRRRDAFAFTTADCNPGNRPRSTRPRTIPNIMTVRYTPARRRDAFRSRTTPSAHLSIWTGPRTFLIVASAQMWRIANDTIPFLRYPRIFENVRLSI